MKKFKIEYVDPKKLVPYKLNAKTHPQAQLDLLTHSIVNFEPDQPIVCDENFEIIKGHGRLLVFLQRNYKKCPVIIRDDLTDTEKRAARLADNRSAESPLDRDILRMELNELSADMDLKDLGFGADYLAELDIDLGLDGGDGESPPEEFPEYDEGIETKYCCPKCNYRWSGKPK